jgi:hypothetical protein
MNSRPQSNKMQRTGPGQNGGAALIHVFCRRRDEGA